MSNLIFQLNFKNRLLPDIRWYEPFYLFWYEESVREFGPSISDIFCITMYGKVLMQF
jgi:hypothetical protein